MRTFITSVKEYNRSIDSKFYQEGGISYENYSYWSKWKTRKFISKRSDVKRI
ncbi:hypothetical protein CNEO4_1260023 [Clostridium neonatale]|uniref:Uncharacterized protein n=1 Tax=Clostridium neonatale TaxID=137838 RepID=A0AA86MIG0_9CLOT|nr:hypothetical protein CNEO_41071 [Clostridium neonatale]CAI3697112.1 hypothetical protein CNEO3_680023 [Clostridium neonatale]CAI4138058.1 hypothetical protein CNEO4_1260023 [Clostridium neonatale]